MNTHAVATLADYADSFTGTETPPLLKGLSLLYRHRLPIAPCFIVTSQAFTQFLTANNLDTYLTGLIKDCRPDVADDLAQVAVAFKRRILHTAFPQPLTDALFHAYDVTANNQFARLVKVQFHTNLNLLPVPDHLISGDSDFINTLRLQWSEIVNATLIRQHLLNGEPLMAPPFLVQTIPSAAVSGICHPVAGPTQKETVKCATIWGLSALFAGVDILPDIAEISRVDGSLFRSHAVSQAHGLFPDRHGQLVIKPLPKNQVNQPKITPTDLKQIGALAKLIHNLSLKPVSFTFTLNHHQLTVMSLAETEPTIEICPQTTKAPSLNTHLLATGIACSPGVATGQIYPVTTGMKVSPIPPGSVLALPSSSIKYFSFIKAASALIAAEGGLTTHLAIVARELGIPLVSGISFAQLHVSPGTSLTINGLSGTITTALQETDLQPNPPVEFDPVTQPTATKVLVTVSDPHRALAIAAGPVDGAGLVQGSYLLTQFGGHPHHLKNTGKLADFERYLTDSLFTIAQAFGDRPVFYLPTDLRTSDLSALSHGHDFEPTEANPLIGYRGAYRHLADHLLFDLEVAALKHLQSQGLTNLSLLLPYVRHLNELTQLKRHLYSLGLTRTATSRFWLSVDTPGLAFSLDHATNLGVDGLSLNLDHLTPLMVGVDPDSGELQSLLDPRHPGVLALIHQVTQTAERLHLPVNVRGFLLTKYPDLLTDLVSWGVASVTVDPMLVQVIRARLYHAELHHLNHPNSGV